MGAGPTVLIVDDHRVLAEAVAGTLRTAGCSVTVAQTFKVDALTAAVSGHERVVVLLDLHLGDASGLPLIRPLAAAGAAVIVLTANTDPRLLGRSLTEGAVAVLGKELPFATILDSIRRAALGQSAMPVSEREALLAVGRQLEAEHQKRLAPFAALSPREQVVLRHLVSGRGPREIARVESVSLATVRSQLRTVFEKLRVNSQREAIALAHAAGWS